MSLKKAIAPALGLAFILAFAWVGGAALITAVQQDPLKLPLDPDISSDSVLSRIGGPHATKTVNEMLQAWSDNQVVLVVAPGTNPSSTKIYYELLILGYPRRLPAIICDPKPGPGAAYHPELASTNIDGLIFLGIVPGSGLTGVRKVTPELYVAPYKGVPRWNSFCP
jgi:hypothetical protein